MPNRQVDGSMGRRGFDAGAVATLYRTELRMALRDRRTVFFSVVLPLAVMPVIMFSSLWAQKSRTAELAAMTHTYAVTGSEADTARAWIAAALTPVQAQRSADGAEPPAARAQRFETREVADPASAVRRGELSCYVVAEKDEAPSALGGRGSDGETAPAGTTRLTFVYRGDRDTSLGAARELRRRLALSRRDVRAGLLEARGFPLPPAEVGATTERDVASAGHVAGLGLGRMVTLFLLLFVFTGGSIVATDSLAGEKERGTLETLLASAASRGEIIVAKNLVVFTAALLITLIQGANFFVYVLLEAVPVGKGITAAVTPATVPLLLLLYLPVIALVSSALLATSGWARTFKEAQLYFMPLMVLGLVPAVVPMIPTIHLRSAIVLVPIANIAVAAKEILTGSRDFPFIALAWIVTSLAAAAVARVTVRMLSTERLVSSADTSREDAAGGPGLFPRRVLRAFALMWVAALVGSGYLGTSVRAQLLFNIGVVFIGGSLLLVKAYRLQPRSAFALRPVKPVIWLGVAAAAPGGLIALQGLALLLQRVLPIPQAWYEEFGRQLLPADVPLWQMLPLITLLPGIGEELAFRGVLLHGLRRRLHPAALALVVGAAFGVFHFALPRLIPTACLGTALAAVTLLTGSIFPAMAWHALNNALAVGAGLAGYPLGEMPGSFYAAGVVLTALGFWVFWRNRTPYPDLRPWRRTR